MLDVHIAVIFPSRGLVFSQTAAELLNNLNDYNYKIFFAHGLPIPDCFETPLFKVLKDPSFTHIFFVEDDMILPRLILDKMLTMDVPVVTCDYPVSKEGQGSIFKNAEGQIIFAGTGCLLVKRAVFNKLKAPYFRTDIRWGAINHGSFVRMRANYMPNAPEGYGLHDVTFGMKLWQAGIPISESDNIGQRKLIKLGEPGTNEGAHQIETWTKIKPNFLYKKFKKMPVQPLGKLVPVNTPEGELMVHPDKAKKLIKAGIAAKVPKQSVAIDYNEVEI